VCHIFNLYYLLILSVSINTSASVAAQLAAGQQDTVIHAHPRHLAILLLDEVDDQRAAACHDG
jgi:hypothetical protein